MPCANDSHKAVDPGGYIPVGGVKWRCFQLGWRNSWDFVVI